MVIKIATGLISSYVILRRLTPKVEYTINSYPWTNKKYLGDEIISAETTDFLLFNRTSIWVDSPKRFQVYKDVKYHLRRISIKINEIKDEQTQSFKD